jgi:transketolase
MVLNQARILSTGRDFTLITSGIMTEEALRAVPILSERGINLTHLHVSTIKPFSDPIVIKALLSAKLGVITMENHSIIGGIGSAVAELMAEEGVSAKLSRIGVRDTYAHGASQKYLMRELELDARALITQVEKMIGKSLDISEEELSSSRIVDVHSSAKAEAL